MAHGQPDFGMYAATSTVASMADMAELAARLGSIVTFDRRGNVIWLEDFEHDIGKWETGGLGTGMEVVISSEKARNGQFSAKLVGGSTLGGGAQIKRWSAFPVLGAMGLEVSFAIDSDLNVLYIYFYAFDGDDAIQGKLLYDHVNKKLQYEYPVATWNNIATNLKLEVEYYTFNTIKIVVDFKSQVWKRVILNEVEYPLPDVPLIVFGSGITPQFRIEIDNANVAGTNGTVYIDDVIVTQNEP